MTTGGGQQVGGHREGDRGPHGECGEEPLERHAAAQGLRRLGPPQPNPNPNPSTPALPTLAAAAPQKSL